MRTPTPPKAPAGSTAVGILIALVLVGAGVLGVHDGLTGLGWASGRAWLPPALEAVDGAHAATWMLVVAAVLALLGLWLVLLALKPRRRTHLPAPDREIDLWSTPAALAAVARRAADRQSGVMSATAQARRRRVDVDVTTRDGADAGVDARVQEAVEQNLEGLLPPRVRVRVRTREVNR